MASCRLINEEGPIILGIEYVITIGFFLYRQIKPRLLGVHIIYLFEMSLMDRTLLIVAFCHCWQCLTCYSKSTALSFIGVQSRL